MSKLTTKATRSKLNLTKNPLLGFSKLRRGISLIQCNYQNAKNWLVRLIRVPCICKVVDWQYLYIKIAR